MRQDVNLPHAPVGRWSIMRRVQCGLLRLAAGAVVAALIPSLGCSEDDDGVSYKTEIRPILQARCVLCHDEENALSLADPFDPERGLFMVKNTWWETGHPALENNVVPYDPEASFLIQKISDQELIPGVCDTRENACAIEDNGLFMPPRPAPTTRDQNDIVRQWILDGAGDTADFREKVVPFFGNAGSCGEGGFADFCVPCTTCHYEDGPGTPNLVKPDFKDRQLTAEEQDAEIAAWLQTFVGVKASYRSDLNLVEPGNPDASFLLMKIEAEMPSSSVGAPMPLGFEPLTEAQVDRWRQWILEGARNN